MKKAITYSGLMLLLAFLFGSYNDARAGQWFVKTTGNDSDDCLTAATACGTINGALNKPGFVPGDTIRVAIGTYPGTSTEVVLLDKDATLTGGWDQITFTTQSGTSIIDGEGSRTGITVFLVTAIVERFVIQNGLGGITNFGTLTLNHSTVSNNSALEGGGILHGFGMVTLNNSTVSGNSASLGGGIFNSGPAAPMELNNSTVSGNSASQGGGIFADGPMTLNNSTVSGNTAGVEAGGIRVDSGPLTLNNSTITGNSAPTGGGILTRLNLITLTNTIVADNLSDGDCVGAPALLTSNGHNLDSDGSCMLSGTGDISNASPLLGPLADNGGPTLTHALLPGSLAIDAVPVANCTLTTDQRGLPRPQGGACDIGAFESIVDTDGDGISDAVDIEPDVPSNEFSDETVTTTGEITEGEITDRGGRFWQIIDEPTGGVRILVSGGSPGAQVEGSGSCTPDTVVDIDAGGMDFVFSCTGSTTVEVTDGSGQVTATVNGLAVTTLLGAGSGVTFDLTEDGTLLVTNLSSENNLVITVNGEEVTIAPGETETIVLDGDDDDDDEDDDDEDDEDDDD